MLEFRGAIPATPRRLTYLFNLASEVQHKRLHMRHRHSMTQDLREVCAAQQPPDAVRLSCAMCRYGWLGVRYLKLCFAM